MTRETHEDDLTAIVHGMKTVASPFRTVLNELHRTYQAYTEGTAFQAMTELARANPNWFGICVVDTSGQIYEVGDSQHAFTTQALATPFVYGLVLANQGRADVLARIGVMPADDSFHLPDPPGQCLPNPLVPAGAIATVNMLAGNTTDRLNHILELFQQYTGHEMRIDATVFTASRLSGHRYRALAYHMLDRGLIGEHVDETLDLFFQQQSLLVTCRDLAVMGATLANRGTNPITGASVLSPEHVRDLLSVMSACGMRNLRGEWNYHAGMPAESGVSGGLLAVVPGQVGIGVFSPLLGPHGHSLRGIKVVYELVERFGLHQFDAPHAGTKLREAFAGRSATTTRNRVARALETSD